MGTRVDRAHPLLALAWPGPGILSAWGQINIGSNWGNIKLDKASLEQIIRDETHLKYIFLWFARFFSVFSKKVITVLYEHASLPNIRKYTLWKGSKMRKQWFAQNLTSLEHQPHDKKLLPQNKVYDLVSQADEWGLVAFHIKGLLEQLCCIMLVDLAQMTFQVFRCVSISFNARLKAVKTLSELHSVFCLLDLQVSEERWYVPCRIKISNDQGQPVQNYITQSLLARLHLLIFGSLKSHFALLIYQDGWTFELRVWWPMFKEWLCFVVAQLKCNSVSNIETHIVSRPENNLRSCQINLHLQFEPETITFPL